MKTLKVKWTGIRPMLMSNGLMADPTNPIVRRTKEITSKGSKKLTDSDYQELFWLKWCGALYWDEKAGPVIPSDNIERCIQLGAQKSRIGKDVVAALFCTEPFAVLDYDGPRDMKKMFANPAFALRKLVVINKVRVMGIRPMFASGWSTAFGIEYDDSILNEAAIVKAMTDAGALIGLGDWRPKFGRFIVEVL